MARRVARVTQAEIARALRAVHQVLPSAVVLIEPDGSIKIIPTTEADRLAIDRAKEIVL